MGFAIFMKRAIVVHAVTILAPGAALQSVQKFVVCQNKDCCQRWKLKTPLPDVLQDLFGHSNVLIETTSCFSQCDKGPNLCVSTTLEGKRSDVYLNDVKDAISLITLLDEAVSVDVQPKLLAAVNVFEKALSAKSLEEKELFCSSIIRTLEIEGDLCMSTATARASIFLAEVLMEARRHEDAIAEVTKTIGRLTSSSSESANASHTTLLTRAYRVLGDVYEQTGNYRGAVESILSMASCNPTMRTKVSKEIDRLRLLDAQQSSS